MHEKRLSEIRCFRVIGAASATLFAFAAWGQSLGNAITAMDVVPTKSLNASPSHRHDPYYPGYTGYQWERDFGVLAGRCNTGAIAAAIGGRIDSIAGSGLIASSDRIVATIMGSGIAIVIRAKAHHSVDDTDRACIGHALELSADGWSVAWSNADTRIRYQLTPVQGFYTHSGVPCREFSLRLRVRGGEESMRAAACRRDEGLWDFVSPIAS